ncbi:putative iron-only hydrogenase system regulator [Desulfohalotomaculum tongense]|uniref:TM1266 family iron-only hydrogenase system putative regulator n=1 Tax=Desulforadius tongensis TaxID=1216062 RepID=UPI00195D6C69|nr:putative iron-only hydrogenase system regulator [Desulforadius tongensis]
MERDITILGLLVDERASHAPEVQDVLTRYGARILSRSGIPAPSKNRGIITLTMEASQQERQEMEQELGQIHGVQVRSISFGVPSDVFHEC